MTTAQRIVSRFQNRTAQSHWKGKFLGDNARLRWDQNSWLLEELPQKGKKTVKVATLDNPGSRGWDRFSAYIPENILREANLSPSDKYEAIKKKITDAYEAAAEMTITSMSPEQLEKGRGWDWLREIKWYENNVFYLKIEPEGTEPFVAEGKDFSIKVGWTSFKTYSPDSDFQQSDPSYTIYESTAPTSARKLYQILKADPNALKSITWGNLHEWFKKNKINYETHFSVWH